MRSVIPRTSKKTLLVFRCKPYCLLALQTANNDGVWLSINRKKKVFFDADVYVAEVPASKLSKQAPRKRDRCFSRFYGRTVGDIGSGSKYNAISTVIVEPILTLLSFRTSSLRDSLSTVPLVQLPEIHNSNSIHPRPHLLM